ncbi:MAG: cytochrome c, partial [Blastocatellia bacterium]|nr:cytochrome c [Blastocatellia bacterium]
MTSKRLFLPLVIVAIALIGLTFSTSGGRADSRKEVTFSKDVAPIFYKDCAQCHRPDDIAPMSLMSYKEARPWARSIKEKVLAREMPPWDADPNYGEFSNVHRLSQEEIDTVVAWVDQGAKEGNPKNMPPVPDFVKGWEIGKPDVILSMQEEYTVEVGAPDNYINFTIPTNFKEDKWVQAAEIHPGNKTVVHHVIAFIVTPEMKAKMKEAERQGQTRRRGEGRSIFYRDGTLSRVTMDAPVVDDGCGEADGGRARQGRGEGADGLGALLAGYAPGKGVDVWPEGMAKKVPAGSDIVFQIHYSNVFNGVATKPVKDRTSLALVFAKEVPDKAIMTFAVANHSFKIPAGVENHKVTACQTMKWDVEVIDYMPHMHLRGKDMRYDVIYPDGRKETLLWVPDFNFNWQTMYNLKKPVKIPKGTKIIVTAHFDNSKKNKYNPDPTKDIRWGDPTYDEMMIGWMD